MKRILLIVLFGITFLISSAFAISELKETMKEITSEYWSETKRIDFNEYLVYKFQGSKTNTIEVSIEVVRGDSIDTLLFSSQNFTGFQSMMQSGKPKPYYPYPEGKGMNLKYESYSFDIPADGTYFIVIDNTYLPNNGGTPGGSVDVTLKFNKKRCLECEEAELENQKRTEEANRILEEEQRKLQEEANLSKASKSTPGFENIFSMMALTAVYLIGRKKLK